MTISRTSRSLAVAIAALSAAVLIVSPAIAKPLGQLHQFRTPTSNAGPRDIANGPDGNLWYTYNGLGINQHGLGRVTQSGDITEFVVCDCSMLDVVEHDEALWFTNTEFVLPDGWGIGRMTPDGSFGYVPLPQGASVPGDIASDGTSLWVADFNNNIIWRYTPSAADPLTGTFTRYDVPTPAATPFAIAVDSAGIVWFTEFNANQIGRLDPSTGAITEIPVQGAPRGIAIATDGRVWFTERFDHAIGVLDPATNQVQMYPTTPGAGPEGIAAAPDGNLWFAQNGPAGQNIARISPTGVITEAKRVKNSGPSGITIDPEGDPWYTMTDASKIATLDLP